jgi:prepilin signal peptidase PulO-like enzyme (type II secretory pathway)
VGSGVLVLIALLFVPLHAKILLGFALVAIYLLVYSWIFMKVVEKEIMVKEYPISKLTEGDWVVHEVKNGKKIIVPANSTGITLEQIAQLKKTKLKSVTVKEGIPFVPGFMLAFIVLLIAQHYGGILRFFM